MARGYERRSVLDTSNRAPFPLPIWLRSDLYRIQFEMYQWIRSACVYSLRIIYPIFSFYHFPVIYFFFCFGYGRDFWCYLFVNHASHKCPFRDYFGPIRYTENDLPPPVCQREHFRLFLSTGFCFLFFFFLFRFFFCLCFTVLMFGQKWGRVMFSPRSITLENQISNADKRRERYRMCNSTTQWLFRRIERLSESDRH